MESKEIKIVPKVWGSEKWIVNTPNYCGKELKVKKGKRCSLHYHKNKDETFYVIEGKILMEVGNKIWVMKKGDVQRVTQLTKHRFSGLKDSNIIFEFSTHHEDSDSYREKDQLSENVSEEIMEKYSE